jgi:hypothetical protein
LQVLSAFQGEAPVAGRCVRRIHQAGLQAKEQKGRPAGADGLNQGAMIPQA